MTNIGIIGVGNIASTIINGITNSPLKDKVKLFGFNGKNQGVHLTKLASEKRITAVNSQEDLIKQSDYILFCLKPNVIHSVLKGINKSALKNKILMSVAAGVSLEDYAKDLGNDIKFIRIMPNVNAAVLQAMTAIVGNKNISPQELSFAINIFEQVGKVIELDESLFDIFMAISGSFPAAIYMLVDTIANVGVEFGLKKDVANQIATQMIYGSAAFAQKEAVDNNTNVRALMDIVMSPAGTTINGVERLEEFGFSKAVEKAVIAMMSPYKKD